MPTHEFIVESLKIRLDRYLAEQLTEISRSKIQRDIEGGYVEVNGQPITESKFVVRLNDKVVYREPEITAEEEIIPSAPLKVLYHDKGLLIIDKPAGMTVHPGAGFKGETLVSALLYQFKNINIVGEEGRPGIVHRLDKDTSGVILVATTQEMYEYLKDAFFERRIKKEYIALVLGKIEKPHGLIDTPIGRSKTDFRKYSVKNTVEPKESLTEYQVLEHLQDPASLDEYTLILVKLHTGRTHQIRVHLSSIGFPLVGDSLYGNKRTERKDLHRQFLHAKKIEVQMPDKTWIESETDLAPDLKEVLHNLHSKKVSSL
jgi:23S rRNA pseudouridine1911/1915/1917 synthase